MSTVAVLICTYDGEKHVRKQLDSIVAQRHGAWCIFASDDGSTDGTRATLEEYRQRLGDDRLRIFQGPRKGFAANFFSLVAHRDVAAEYYAFTDQDDEWDARKLERAVSALSRLKQALPGLYGSRSELIDEQGAHLGFSRLFRKPAGFANALVQNMVSGNTMVLNGAAMALIRAVGTDLTVSAHDWWAYLLVTGCGGQMIYDTYPTIRYRQHRANLYGANVSLKAMWTRVRRLFAGDFHSWNAMNLAALRRSWPLLTEESRQRVEMFERARRGSIVHRLSWLIRSRVYRQTWDGQLGLLVAALTRRL